MRLKIHNLLLIGIVFLINFTSSWFYRIAKDEPVMAVVLFIFSITFSLILIKPSPKWLIVSTAIGFIIISIFFSLTHLEKDLYKPIPLDINSMTVRQSYYPGKQGVFIHNRFTLGFYKYERNFFTNFNFNQFFFGGEPRFRPYALDFEKYPEVDLAFFLISLIYLARLKKQILKYLFSYLLVIFLVLSLADPGNMLGIYPLFPLITAIVSFGTYSVIIDSYKLTRRLK